MVSAVTVAICVVAAFVASALILLTSWQHAAAATLNSVVRGVHLAENLQVDLLAHSRSPRSAEATQKGEAVRRDFRDLGRYMTSPDQARLYREAERALDAHFESPDDPKALEVAVVSLERLVDASLTQAEAAFVSTQQIDSLANGIAVGLASLILLLAAGLLVWLRRTALVPIVALSEALEHLAGGDFETRVAKSGPRELRQVEQGFNDMAEAISRQRTNRLTFLAGVAHDLRTPVTTLRLSLSSMGREPERTARVLTMAQRQIDRLERMLGDLVDATRIEAGQLELRMSRIDLADIARNTFELFDGEEGRGRLRLVLPDSAVHVHVDGARLEQVATNLVSNALKYSPEGGAVVITVETERDFGVLSVRDEGVGLSEEEQAAVFEPFRRVGALRDQVTGIGLGLSVSRRIVRAHGGSIEVESAPGRGSTFRVRVPLEPRTEAVTHAP